ncbi:MAG TPA: bifunctional hydroxymethylpyrimidine kinase/phosphomethylpyrimidine kinase [Candidatus Hydrogenedentes bacterium]|nr:bifunctional hydroxymethylpyrimidine kinase/phosphomethylpyrimidine kinase [Candidatus Hydrogenedentota bacterium]HOL78322.1 bifunctional hydroxymethylpyrimidine kinase/phosphomethylpyrimidine kinase [Candidatus Hydrogenedentota bacterium]HPO87169.1 bifunctional hydroxymethylpyrimidine kinase/phosphomethylpyrimidine kinase [Candidatus Hydrogenedentota bacterium]
MSEVARALTIAGSDSGGGAGIEADLKTFTALGVYGMAAVTSITAQNTCGVYSVYDVPAQMVTAQIDAVTEDIGVDAAKTGMLSNAEIVEGVCESIRRNQISRLVVDPVMIAKSGDALLQPDAIKTFITRMIPLAFLITPNIPEAEKLTGQKISTVSDVNPVIKHIADLGAKNVLLKGGHMGGKYAVDWLYDGENLTEFTAPRINTHNTHGTGCTLSAAITAFLAKGINLYDAVRSAKNYLTVAIRHSFDLGKGVGPLNHFWVFSELEEDR